MFNTKPTGNSFSGISPTNLCLECGSTSLEEMASTFDGDFISLGKGGTYGMINPLEVIVDADEEEIKQGLGYTIFTRTLQTIKAFLKYYDPSIEEDVVNMFSEVVQETYKRFGIDFDTDFTKYKSVSSDIIFLKNSLMESPNLCIIQISTSIPPRKSGKS